MPMYTTHQYYEKISNIDFSHNVLFSGLQALISAWEADHRVKALKIAIQVIYDRLCCVLHTVTMYNFQMTMWPLKLDQTF